MKRWNLDIQDEKPVRNDAGELCLNDRAKQAGWKEHYERLSNEFDWDPDPLTEIYPMEGLVPNVLLELVIKAMKLMKCGKAANTSLIVPEMLKAFCVEGAQQLRY